MAEQLGCAGVGAADCLREADVADIREASENGAGFGPVFDTDVLPTAPAQAIAAGDFARVPILHGTTRDEYRLHTWGLELMNGHPLTETEYGELIGQLFGDNAGDVLATYPSGAYDSPALAFTAAMTDYTYAHPAFRTGELLAGHVPTYAYVFADEQTPWFRGLDKPSYATGAYHSSELPYLFDVDYAEKLTPAQSELSAEMIGYWTRFARTGDPNGGVEWPTFTGADHYVQSLASGPGGTGQADFAADHHINFWQSLG